ncbi:MAG: hypothetical protein B6U95_00345 [Thermofilum sp. ex4484_82]|nr:MAG: hypothetical protein B6U95_00345 [Thermofilum sp. ex4484_82]OYT40065.1 MAG: hypothetical protein B6U96_00350 [Archaeoglobales archaeon ex4484_92]
MTKTLHKRKKKKVGRPRKHLPYGKNDLYIGKMDIKVFRIRGQFLIAKEERKKIISLLSDLHDNGLILEEKTSQGHVFRKVLRGYDPKKDEGLIISPSFIRVEQNKESEALDIIMKHPDTLFPQYFLITVKRKVGRKKEFTEVRTSIGDNRIYFELTANNEELGSIIGDAIISKLKECFTSLERRLWKPQKGSFPRECNLPIKLLESLINNPNVEDHIKKWYMVFSDEEGREFVFLEEASGESCIIPLNDYLEYLIRKRGVTPVDLEEEKRRLRSKIQYEILQDQLGEEYVVVSAEHSTAALGKRGRLLAMDAAKKIFKNEMIIEDENSVLKLNFKKLGPVCQHCLENIRETLCPLCPKYEENKNCVECAPKTEFIDWNNIYCSRCGYRGPPFGKEKLADVVRTSVEVTDPQTGFKYSVTITLTPKKITYTGKPQFIRMIDKLLIKGLKERYEELELGGKVIIEEEGKTITDVGDVLKSISDIPEKPPEYTTIPMIPLVEEIEEMKEVKPEVEVLKQTVEEAPIPEEISVTRGEEVGMPEVEAEVEAPSLPMGEEEVTRVVEVPSPERVIERVVEEKSKKEGNYVILESFMPVGSQYQGKTIKRVVQTHINYITEEEVKMLGYSSLSEVAEHVTGDVLTIAYIE